MAGGAYRLCDLHVHTEHSSDATGTIGQAVRAAAERGVEVLAITNHCPELPGSIWHDSLRKLQDMKAQAAAAGRKYGLRVLVGAEIEVIDFVGNLNAPDLFIEQCDLVIAAVHWFPGLYYDEQQRPRVNAYTRQDVVPMSMKMIVGAVRNRAVDIIAHIGYELAATKQPQRFLDQPQDYPELYIQQIATEAARGGTAIEINEAGFPDERFLRICLEAGCTFALGSDAHEPSKVGRLDWACQMVERLGIGPDRLLYGRP